MRHFDLSGFNSVIRMKMLTAVLYFTKCFLSQSQTIMENLHAAESVHDWTDSRCCTTE